MCAYSFHIVGLIFQTGFLELKFLGPTVNTHVNIFDIAFYTPTSNVPETVANSLKGCFTAR